MKKLKLGGGLGRLAVAGMVAWLAISALPRDAAAAPTPEPTSTREGEAGTRTATVKRGGQELQTAGFAPATAPDGRPMRAGSLIVKFRKGAPEAARSEAHRAAGAQAAKSVAGTAERVQVEPGAVGTALASYRARRDVETAEPDYLFHKSFVPNDPRFSSQWNLSIISAPAAWDATHGSPGTRIAILDTGIHTRHPDIGSKVILEQNFSPSRFGADDLADHGTLVAGIASAATNNGVGIAGVGFDSPLLNGKVMDDFGVASTASVIAGLRWAADNGARSINPSLGRSGPCPSSLQEAIDYAWSAGAVIVAAAGNDGAGQSESPGNCQHVLSVAASDRSDQRAYFSNYGADVDLAAPGVDILSTDFRGGYEIVDGTSFSSPHVAGVAALVWSTAFGTSPTAVVDRILATADRVPGTGSFWTAGRVNAAAAMGASDLALAGFVDSPDPASVGQQVTFTTTVANRGPQASTATRLINKFDPSLEFVSAGASRGTGCAFKTAAQRSADLGRAIQLSRVACEAGALANGESVSMTVVMRATASSPSGGHSSVAKAKATAVGESDPNQNNNRVTETTTVR